MHMIQDFILSIESADPYLIVHDNLLGHFWKPIVLQMWILALAI